MPPITTTMKAKMSSDVPWPGAIEPWLAEARAHGWIPAVMGASEEAGTVYARHGLDALELGDEALVEVAEQITEKGPGSAAEFSCDLRSVQEIEAVLAAINVRFGRLDVVVNVAGLANRTPVEDITEAEWDLLNDVNLKAPFFLTQALHGFCRSHFTFRSAHRMQE